MSDKEKYFDVVFCKMCLIKVKGFSELALKHLEEVNEDLPDDPQFKQTLWLLLDAVGKAGDDIDNKVSTTLSLPGVDS